MSNYVFVSNESLENVEKYYTDYLLKKKESFHFFSDATSESQSSARVVFVLENQEQIPLFIKSITKLNDNQIKSTVIASKNMGDYLAEFLKLNSTVLISEPVHHSVFETLKQKVSDKIRNLFVFPLV